MSLTRSEVKLISIIFLFFGIMFCSGISCSGQCAPCPPVSLPSGIPSNQSVKIEFLRLEKEKGIIWLRLTNWTAWAIRIPVEMFPFPTGNISVEVTKQARNHPNGAEANVRYYLEEYDSGPSMQMITASGKKIPLDEPAHSPVPRIHRIDVFTEWWIKPEESVIFQVPKEHVARNIMLNVDIRYEWENGGVGTLEGPVHRVFFVG